MFDLLYAYLYWRRHREDDWNFERKYHKTVKDINARLNKSYLDLAGAINQRGTLIDYRGDYLFVAIKPGKHIDIPWLHPVRRLRKYVVGEVSELEAKHPKLDI